MDARQFRRDSDEEDTGAEVRDYDLSTAWQDDHDGERGAGKGKMYGGMSGTIEELGRGTENQCSQTRRA